MREKSPYSELFWSTFFRPTSVRMRENTDQNNSEYGYCLRSVVVSYFRILGGTYSKWNIIALKILKVHCDLFIKSM